MRFLLVAAVAFVTFPAAAQQNKPFRYPEAKHGKGELRYVNHLPVAAVAGTPEEIGEQVGVLVLKPTADLRNSVKDFLRTINLENAYPLLVRTGSFLLPQFPPHHRKELDAAAKASGFDRDLMVFANTVFDVANVVGCSTLIVEPSRSKTGAVIFGRNLDYPPFGRMHEYPVVTVYRPRGKHAFAAINFPGLVGCVSGMNDAGLAVTWNMVNESKDGGKFDPLGVPRVLLLRRVLEECTTVVEAEKLIRSVRRTGLAALTVCDKEGGAVFEVTSKTVRVRRSTEGLCACTNHFRTEELATSTRCHRFDTLLKSWDMPKIGVADVSKQLHAVNQGRNTIQTMVFEPAALRLHLAFGSGPASALPLRALELGPLFRNGFAKE
jgi:isopenicillin-N N-acyltransferase like protein